MGSHNNSVLYEVEEYSQGDDGTDDEENTDHQVRKAGTVVYVDVGTFPFLRSS